MIRKSLKEDIPKIEDLGKNLIANFSLTYNLDDYINKDNYLVLVSIDRDINGFLIISETMDTYELEVIYVKENERRKNIASNLLNSFLDNYYNKNKAIFLEVSVDNEPAIKLYQKFNFEIINKRPKYYNGIDAYVMKRVK